MNLNRQKYGRAGVILALILALAGCVQSIPTGEGSQPIHVVIDNAAEVGVQPDEPGSRSVAPSGASETGFNNMQVAGYVDVQTNLYVGDWVHVFTQTPIAVTDGAVITPTGTYQPLTSSGAVTATLTTSASYVTAGDTLFLLNASPTVTTTINIADSGTAMLSAAGALGQYDSLTLFFDGTNWIELSRSDN